MYSSAYVYIYTYGFVYIFCIDIQIGLILSKYQKCFVQSVLPVMSGPYICSLLQCCFFLLEIWSLLFFFPSEAAHLLFLFMCCFIQGVPLLSSFHDLTPSFCLDALTCEFCI